MIYIATLIKGSRSAKFISDKIDFRAHKTIRAWEKDYMIVKSHQSTEKSQQSYMSMHQTTEQ